MTLQTQCQGSSSPRLTSRSELRGEALPAFREPDQRPRLLERKPAQRESRRGPCVHELFQAQVARTPSAVALVCQNERMSYAELNRRADEVADRLRALGIGPDVPVGICLERSREMVIGVLGIMKAGGAYVPLDPAYPKERLRFMIGNSQSPLVLTQRKLEDIFKSESSNCRSLCVEDLLEPTHTNSAKPRTKHNGHTDSAHPEPSPPAAPRPPRASDLAYIIHTSGSTGAPKGVAIEHRQAVNFICWAQQAFTRAELAGVLFSTSLCFDLSVFELFVTLSTGGKVIMARNAIHLPDLPAKHEVTLINTVPSAATELLRLQAIPPSVQVINLAGEPLKTALVDRLYALGTVKKVHDLYGPSETTTYSTYVLRQAGAPATVGRPIANTQIHLLDEKRQPVPFGEIGEIYIGGAGVARGYLHRPDLTAERFVPDPFSADANARLYRTGDVARWRPDDNLEFLGRMDHQIKIRGYRIELGEIETVLAQHPTVRECVVIAREDTPDEKRLVAYMVPDSDPGAGPAELRRFLQTKLPDYMLPSAFVPLTTLPLTPNGKVDRKALPAPPAATATLETSRILPRTPIEEVIAAVWAEVLGVDQVGVRDNFFGLGGYSLLMIRIIDRLGRAGLGLTLNQMLQHQTVEELAAAVNLNRAVPTGSDEWSSLVTLQPRGERPPFFLLHTSPGDVLGYMKLVHYLGSNDQPVYGFQSLGLTRPGECHRTVPEMAAHYVKLLRQFQPVGPYYLGGWCFGGNAAMEMAHLLVEQGQSVALLALIETWANPPPLKSRLYFVRRMAYFRRLGVLGAIRHYRRKVASALARRVSAPVVLADSFAFEATKSGPLKNRERVYPVNLSAFHRHHSRAQVYPGRVTLFFRENHGEDAITPEWDFHVLAREVESHLVTGDHRSVLKEPHVKALSVALNSALLRAQAPGAEAQVPARSLPRPQRKLRTAAHLAPHLVTRQT